FPYHFFDINTGNPASGAEISTIDAAILACGALFTKRYFSKNQNIAHYADALFNSMNWKAGIKDSEYCFRELDHNGVGKENSATRGFNEYIILSYLASNAKAGSNNSANYDYHKNPLYQHHDLTGAAQTNTVRTYYWGGANLKGKLTDTGTDVYVLTDQAEHKRYISSFIVQLCYFLCHDLSVSDDFIKFGQAAAAADYTWWKRYTPQDGHALPIAYWGLGAGYSPGGCNYCAESIDKNNDLIVSPHTVAGFLPFSTPTGNDIFKHTTSRIYNNLYNMYAEHLGETSDGALYTLNDGRKSAILWRFSVAPNLSTWRATQVNLVDFSSMLFGLASRLMPPSSTNNVTAENFFPSFNDFFSSTTIPQDPH
ncbi:MAG: hypothetical protein ACOYXT_23530, partial [Bacteroidota bacterium]